MKRILKCLVVVVAFLMAATSVWAGEVNVIRQLNGTESDAAGEVVVSDPVDGVVTLIVTPASGNYITAEFISIERTIIGGSAQARFNVPGMDGNDMAVTPIDVTNPAGATTHTFEMPAEEYDVVVVANFQSRISIAGAQVTLDIPTEGYSFDGEEKVPDVTKVELEGNTLAVTTDYTVDYSNNINAGTATVTVTGQGIYTGTVSKTFTIDKAPINDDVMMVKIDGWTYGDNPSTPYLEGAPEGVQVEYAYFVMDEESEEFVEMDGVPTNAGSYTIRAIIAESANYLEGELYNEFSIEQANFSEVVIGDIADQTFTGEDIEPAVTVTFKGSPVDASEYSVAYSDNLAVGTATVTLTTNDINFAAGDVNPSKTFQIVSAQANIYAEDQTETYNGDAQVFSSYEADCGEVNVLYYASMENREAGEGTLEQVVDAGVYYVALVPADPSYQCDAVYATFTIQPKELYEDMLTVDGRDNYYIFDGTAITPSVEMNDNEITNSALTRDKDYTVTYANNDKVGTATVTVEGIGNYQGTLTAQLYIVRQLDVYFGESNSWATYLAAENLETPEGLQAYIVTNVNGNQVTVQEVGYIPQGVAVLLEKKNDNTGDIAFAYEGQPGTFNSNMLVGCAAATAVSTLTGENNIYVLYNNEFVRTTRGTIPANRCYLPIAKDQGAGARLSIFVDDSNASGIDATLMNGEESTMTVYDLQGRRMDSSLFTPHSSLKKGLYIVNGKKVVMK